MEQGHEPRPVRSRLTASPPAERGYRRDSATWTAFAALFAFGVLNALLGPVLPYLRQSEHITYVPGALHQVAFALGGMTAGLLAARASGPRQRVISIGLTCAAAAGLLLGYGDALPLTVLAAFLVSAFGTAALIRIWALLAELHSVHRAVAMTEGEIAVSLAGIMTPAAVSVCAATAVSWRFAFVVALVVVVAAAVAAAMGRLPDPPRPPVSDPGERPAADGAAGRAVRRTLGTIFTVVALEFTLSFWAASYLHDDIGVARGAAAALVSALYAANLLGRVVASRLARRLRAAVVLRLALATALLGTPILLAAGDLPTAAVGLAVTGTGIGGTFPLAASLHVAASRRSADQALGQILTIAGVGQIVGPLLAGALAQASELRYGLLVLPALVLLAAATTATRCYGLPPSA